MRTELNFCILIKCTIFERFSWGLLVYNNIWYIMTAQRFSEILHQSNSEKAYIDESHRVWHVIHFIWTVIASQDVQEKNYEFGVQLIPMILPLVQLPPIVRQAAVLQESQSAINFDGLLYSDQFKHLHSQITLVPLVWWSSIIIFVVATDKKNIENSK